MRAMPTNFDYVHSLDKTSLARLISGFVGCPLMALPDYRLDRKCVKNCRASDCWLDWLNQETKFKTAEEAMRFCDETECRDCPVLVEDWVDWRTEYEKKGLHFPCYLNLADARAKYEFREKYHRENK